MHFIIAEDQSFPYFLSLNAGISDTNVKNIFKTFVFDLMLCL